jgi:type VII secretion-associated protein (TIGR03931 family)
VPGDRAPSDGRAAVAPPEAGGTWLPPLVPAPRRRLRAAAGALAAAGVAVGLLAAGAALPPASPPTASPPTASPPTASPPSASSVGELVQYGYAVRLPSGWAHTGGLPERRRSLLTPAAAPDGTDLISVERTPLGYDAGAEPDRARAELRAEFASAVAAGASLSAFDDDARYAGRSVVSYREAGGGTAGEVDWYVVLDGDAQLSVGCRHTPAGTRAVDAACATVVGSLRRTG